MAEQNQVQQAREIRKATHRAARCPWCRSIVIRDDRLVDGYLKRMVVCLREDACGWEAVLEDIPVADES